MFKIVKWIFIALLLFLLIIVGVYYLGPVAGAPNFSSEFKEIKADISTINAYVSQKESLAGEIKTDNQARIIWHDSIGKKTPYAIVYLHGFGASQGEGFPVHTNIADSLKANLYLSRLERHGLVRKDAFEGITAESYMESAAEALAIGQLLGDKVILVATSTGGSQALYLAAKFPDQIEALVLYSPFIEMADPTLQMLSIGPWHEKITEAMIGPGITYNERADSVAKYWSKYYHADAYKALFSMVNHSTTEEVLSEVRAPIFLAYYYKDEANQDDVVSVKAMKEMFKMVSSTSKKEIAFPLTGNHVIASKWRSHDWKAVQDSSYAFLKKALNF